MITYEMRNPVKFEHGNKVGVTGENHAHTQKFFIKGMTDEKMTYIIFVRFSDGSVNSIKPSEVSIDDEGTLIVWEVEENDIFCSGFFEVQLQGSNSSGLIFQTEITRLFADESIVVEDGNFENPNSLTLKLRDEVLETISKISEQQDKISQQQEVISEQQAKIDENYQKILETGINNKLSISDARYIYGVAGTVFFNKDMIPISRYNFGYQELYDTIAIYANNGAEYAPIGSFLKERGDEVYLIYCGHNITGFKDEEEILRRCPNLRAVCYENPKMVIPELIKEKCDISMNTSFKSYNYIYKLTTALINMNSELGNNTTELENLGGDVSKIDTDIDLVKSYIGYTESDILGLEVDFENNRFVRRAGAVGLSAGGNFNKFKMFGGRKRCTVKPDGTISAYYGDSSFDTDVANNLDVMVYQPKFYYRVVPLKLEKQANGLGYHIRKACYYVSENPHSGFKLHPLFYDKNSNEIEYVLLSAYEASYFSNGKFFDDGTDTDTTINFETDELKSSPNVKPISGYRKYIGKAYFEKLAQAKSEDGNWHLETIQALSASQLLMMIEYGTMNLQSALGEGIVRFSDTEKVNGTSLTGSTASLGNSSGSATSTINEINGVQTSYTDNGKVAISYRGVENPWGNIWKHINGINAWGDSKSNGGNVFIADDFNFDENKHTDNYKSVGITLPNAIGYIGAMGYGGEEFDWLFIPTTSDGNSVNPVGDRVDITSNVDGMKIMRYGGFWIDGINSGGFYMNFTSVPNTRGRNVGGRLIYVPTAKGSEE